MPAAGDPSPEFAVVAGLEEKALGLAAGDDVLVAPKLASAPEDAPQLNEGARLVEDATEHQARHGGVHLPVGQRQFLGSIELLRGLGPLRVVLAARRLLGAMRALRAVVAETPSAEVSER